MKEEDGRDGGLEADSDGSIEVVKVEKIQRKCRKRKQDNVHTTNTHERVSTKRPHKQPDIPHECALCPNTLQHTKYSHSALFELLQADTYGTTPERPVECTRYVPVCSLINLSATSKPTQYTG